MSAGQPSSASRENLDATKSQLSVKEYTIGWVCALPVESATARLFFESTHEHPHDYIKTNDTNDYELGSIGGHNVVIALMPAGRIGSVSATDVLLNMKRTFRGLRLSLMVGIAGGAPTLENDIRLGDVVVSQPQDIYGGVFQQDSGKNIQDESFQSTGFLNSPPAELLKVVNGLKAYYMNYGNQIRDDVNRLLDTNTRWKKNYGRPDPKTDMLYKTTVKHSRKGQLCQDYCPVDEQSVEKRRVRDEDEDDPAIHYGLISSGNQLNRDATLRNKYAHEKGVLCFEMEASGVMNDIPCLVIRGICDYSDTHKNKMWQGYAAMNAAAYAAAVLRRLRGDDVPEETEFTKAIRRMNEALDQNTAVCKETNELVKKTKASAHFGNVIDWLNAPDPWPNFNDARELCREGTGQWLLDSDEYKSWKAGLPSFLWLNGIAGSGKTILSSTVIQNLVGGDIANKGVLFFYFTFTDNKKKSTENAVLALISQLYHKNDSAREVLDATYAKHIASGRRPSHKDFREVLQKMIKLCGQLWIVLDAVDECETRSTGANNVMKWIKGLQDASSRVHLLITSRPEPDIQSSIKTWVTEGKIIRLQSNVVQPDIEAYIDARVEELSNWRTCEGIRTMIRTALNNNAQGMFRWVACQFDTLEDCISPKEIEMVLKSLPKTLYETYARIMERIRRNDVVAVYATRLLQLLIYAPRPLTLEEAIDAIITETESKPSFDPANRLPVPEKVVKYCPGLVSLTRHTTRGKHCEVIQLAHCSVREYFVSASPEGPFDQNIAARANLKLCLSHLHSIKVLQVLEDVAREHPFDKVSVQGWRYGKTLRRRQFLAGKDLHPDVDRMKRKYPFATFAATYWSDFASSLESSEAFVDEAIKEFLLSQRLFVLATWGLSERSYGSDCPISPLYFAAWTGLRNSVRMLLKEGANPNWYGEDSAYPLLIAIHRGFDGIAKTLLEHGADLYTPSMLYTPGMLYKRDRLHELDVLNHRSCMDHDNWLLIPYIELQTLYLWRANLTPTSSNPVQGFIYLPRITAETGLIIMTQNVAEHSAETNSRSEEGETALHYAAGEGQTSISIKFFDVTPRPFPATLVDLLLQDTLSI